MLLGMRIGSRPGCRARRHGRAHMRAAVPLVAIIPVIVAAEAAAVALSPTGIVVSDQVPPTVFQVDPLTGDRTIFSSNTIGAELAYNKPGGVAATTTVGRIQLRFLDEAGIGERQ